MEELVFELFGSPGSDSFQINSWVRLFMMTEHFGWLEMKFLAYWRCIFDYFKSPSLKWSSFQLLLNFWGDSVQFC